MGFIQIDGEAASGGGSCVTANDLLTFRVNGCLVSDQICISNDEINSLLAEVTAFVEAVTQTIFCPITECRLFDGSGNNKLFFNHITSDKLLSFSGVTAVGCSDCDISPETVINEGHFLQYDCEGSFPCGKNNIQVCGAWGEYTTIPATVKTAIIYVTLERILPGISGLQTNKNQIDSIVWPDLSMNYKTTDVSFAEVSTGIPYVDQLLQPFIPTTSQIGFFTIGEDDCTVRSCGKVVKGYNKPNCQDHC